MSYIGLPASGDGASCAARARGNDARPVCPAGSLRNVFYGLLGPEAAAVTFRDATGRLVRQPVSRPEGAYLVVLPTDPKRPNVGYFSPAVTPGTGLSSVEYRDGSTCRIVSARRLGGARRCPLKGFVAPELERVSRGAARHARLDPRRQPRRRVSRARRARVCRARQRSDG